MYKGVRLDTAVHCP